MNKSVILKRLRLHGYNVNTDGLNCLDELIQQIEPHHQEKVLMKVIQSIAQLTVDLENNRITKELCQQAIRNCRTERSDDVKLLVVTTAFQIQRKLYCKEQKKFIPIIEQAYHAGMKAISGLDIGDFHKLDCVTQGGLLAFQMTPDILSPWPNERSRLAKQRYYLIWQRMKHHQLFSESSEYTLYQADSLLCCTHTVRSVIMLGILVQLRENVWYLEDPTGCLPMNLSTAEFNEGLYFEGCVLLVEGDYVDQMLRVTAIGHPPMDTVTPELLSVSDARKLFGHRSNPAHPTAEVDSLLYKLNRLCHCTEQGQKSMLIFLSDVWLDHGDVWLMVEKLFETFAKRCAAFIMGFVIAGDFLSPSASLNIVERARDLDRLLVKLGNLFLRHFGESNSGCQLILMAGPNDPVPLSNNQVQPRGALAGTFLSKVGSSGSTANPNVVLATSPCRVQCFHRNLVLLRESSLLQRMIKHSIRQPSTSMGNRREQLRSILAKTMLCQAHLFPAAAHIVPVFSNWDQSLWLHPLPDLVVLMDETETRYNSEPVPNGPKFCNPGPFSSTGGCFQCYYPHTNRIQDCQVKM